MELIWKMYPNNVWVSNALLDGEYMFCIAQRNDNAGTATEWRCWVARIEHIDVSPHYKAIDVTTYTHKADSFEHAKALCVEYVNKRVN